MEPLDFVLFVQIFCMIHQYHLIVKAILVLVEDFMKSAHEQEEWQVAQLQLPRISAGFS